MDSAPDIPLHLFFCQIKTKIHVRFFKDRKHLPAKPFWLDHP